MRRGWRAALSRKEAAPPPAALARPGNCECMSGWWQAAWVSAESAVVYSRLTRPWWYSLVNELPKGLAGW